MATLQKKDFNFYQRYQQKPAKKWGFWPIYALLMVLFVIVASGVSYWLYTQNQALELELNELVQGYLENPTLVATQSEVVRNREKLQEANIQVTNLMDAFSAMESYPRANWFYYSIFFQCVLRSNAGKEVLE